MYICLIFKVFVLVVTYFLKLLLLLLLLLLLCPESKKGKEKVNRAATKDLFLCCATTANLAKSLH